jgi:GNAT superfamily N-acetyltransferase
LEAKDLDAVVDVLAEAFASYPVMRFVLGSAGSRDSSELRRLVRFFTIARLLRDEPVIGFHSDARLTAVALVSFPGLIASPPELAEHRDQLWHDLGADARTRYESFASATAQFDIDVPHANLNMIGVRPALHGTGLGRQLMAEVHHISARHPRSSGVTLTTESPRNVSFYQKQGYRLLGRTHVTPDLETWAFFRPDEAADTLASRV